MQKTLRVELSNRTTDKTDVSCLPESLTSLFDSTKVNLGNELTSLCKDIYSQYQQTYIQKAYHNLTKVIILQNLNHNWKLQRGGRITASNFHEVCHKNFDDEENQNTFSLLNKLMLYTTTPNVPVTTYGQKNEKRAWTRHKI